MATADAGQADRNSTDCRTDSGMLSRSIRSNPNRGKNPSAVVVSRKTLETPLVRASASAASVSRLSQPLALCTRLDDYRPQERVFAVELQTGGADDPPVQACHHDRITHGLRSVEG